MPAVGLSEFASTGNKPLTERELRQLVQEGKMYKVDGLTLSWYNHEWRVGVYEDATEVIVFASQDRGSGTLAVFGRCSKVGQEYSQIIKEAIEYTK